MSRSPSLTLGPLSLDVAKALTKQDFDKEQLIRFGASTKF